MDCDDVVDYLYFCIDFINKIKIKEIGYVDLLKICYKQIIVNSNKIHCKYYYKLIDLRELMINSRKLTNFNFQNIDHILNELNSELEKSEELATFEFPQKSINAFDYLRYEENLKYSCLSDINKFYHLFKNLPPIYSCTLCYEINECNFLPKISCIMFTKIIKNCFIEPFFKNFKLNDDVKKNIESIFSLSEFIDKDDVDVIVNSFISIVNCDKNYIPSVNYIIIKFEKSLRYYFETHNITVIRCDNSGDKIELNDIFNNPKHIYQNELIKVIGENLFYTYKFFLIDSNGFNLRNILAHGPENIELMCYDVMFYTVF